MIDVAIVLIVLAYAALGWFGGVIRRVIGFVALYLAFLGATQTAPTAANVILQAKPDWTVSNALIAGFFLIFGALLLVVELLAAISHRRLQLATIAFDRPSGLALGVVTAVAGLSITIFLLAGAAQPDAGSPDGAQIEIGDAIRHSLFAPVLKTVERPSRVVFGAAIPVAPNVFFSGQEARFEH